MVVQVPILHKVLCQMLTYFISDEVSSNYYYDVNNGMYYYGGLPRDIKVLYVVNPERYQTLFGKDYNLKPMLVFNESSLEYTGKTPELTFKTTSKDLT